MSGRCGGPRLPSGDRSLPAPVLMVDEGLELRQAMPDDAEEMFVEIEGNREYLREWLPWLDDITSPEN
ncbi:MAG TPA: hypothetical protein EYP01_06050, partial [Candidatus Poseidoniales archaeon]|nr:hypothetical protein [Candidatus Poseidoniales archaeon]